MAPNSFNDGLKKRTVCRPPADLSCHLAALYDTRAQAVANMVGEDGERSRRWAS